MRLGLLLRLLWGQECTGADLGGIESCVFWGTSSFCIAGQKIPNVVGFGTFPNVVGFLSLQTVPRIEAAL